MTHSLSLPFPIVHLHCPEQARASGRKVYSPSNFIDNPAQPATSPLLAHMLNHSYKPGRVAWGSGKTGWGG